MYVTIATHNGSTVNREHNIRNEEVVSSREHIDPNGHHETWIDESAKDAYHRLFDKYVKAYNKHQQRDDRKIGDYYDAICRDAKKHPVYEMIIGVYPTTESLDHELQREILLEFVNGWKERNPNLELIGAYYHADEMGEPHAHLDYIPVAHNYVRGMSVQTGLSKALNGMGYQKYGKVTPQIAWERHENNHLEKLCNKRGLIVARSTRKQMEHLPTDMYKIQKATQEASERLERILGEIATVEQAQTYHQLMEQLYRELDEIRLEKANLDATILARANEVAKKIC